jgi:hypothetical protein
MSKSEPVVLEQEFNQDQIVAVLGMFLAQLHGHDPRKFDARFELRTEFKDDEGGMEFAAKVTMTEIQS